MRPLQFWRHLIDFSDLLGLFVCHVICHIIFCFDFRILFSFLFFFLCIVEFISWPFEMIGFWIFCSALSLLNGEKCPRLLERPYREQRGASHSKTLQHLRHRRKNVYAISNKTFLQFAKSKTGQHPWSDAVLNFLRKKQMDSRLIYLVLLMFSDNRRLEN